MKKITAEDFIALSKEQSVKLIDVRSPDEFAHKNVPGSINIPIDAIEQHLVEIPRTEPVYFVCHSGNRSGRACERLETLGFTNVVSVAGGVSALERAGALPLNTGGVIPIMRQVQITAGSLVLLGVLLSLKYPAFLFLAGFVGAGLTFAGITGNCALALLLEKLPWNKKIPSSGAGCGMR